jgi:uncharacterized membrane protein
LKKKISNIEKIYDIEGLVIGGAIGFAVGILISFNIIFAMQIGMFLGLIIGTRKKKKKNNIILPNSRCVPDLEKLDNQNNSDQSGNEQEHKVEHAS